MFFVIYPRPKGRGKNHSERFFSGLIGEMKSIRVIITVVFAAIVAMQTLHAQPVSPIIKREFRGVWVSTVANIDWPSSPGLPVQTQKDQLVAILDKIAAAGFNAAVFQIRPECDALYQSSIEPWSYWLTGNQGMPPSPFYDPLLLAVEEAHKRGLELHAWFNPYRAIHGSYVSAYTRSPNHVSNLHPDWILTIGTTRILDPGKQIVRNYVSNVVADVVRRYDIDAAHIDDYFYVEGITTQDAGTFAAEPRGFANLGDWRRDNVNLLIKQVYDSVRTAKSWVKWGVSPRGIWRNGVPPGIVGNDNYSSIYCDAVAWLQARSLDYIAPQLYWRFGGPQDYGLLQPWWSSQRNGRHFYPGLATYRIGEAAFGQATEIARQLRLNRTSGNTEGAIQFTYNSIRDSRGGITDSLVQDVFRFPALVPVMNWKDTIKPNIAQNVRYTLLAGGGSAALQWDLPTPASDGDSAYRYAVYRFSTPVILPGDFDSSKYIQAIEGRRFSRPRVPPIQGPWYYAVTSLDRNYNESLPSTVLTVNPPAAPALTSPPNGTQNLPPAITLSWNGAAAAGSYHLQVSTDPAFAAALFINDSSIVDTFKATSGTIGQMTYYWRVRSINAGGWSNFASAFNFRTGFPALPLLASPANQSQGAPLDTRLAWRPAAGAESYRVQVATSFDFVNIVRDTSGVVDTSIALPPLQLATIYFWRVNATNGLGTSAYTDVWRFRTVLTSVEQVAGLPTEFGLKQNYPNPFNPLTTIAFSVPEQVKVSLRVYDLLGREVETLLDDVVPPGEYHSTFDGAKYASGIYLYRLVAGNYVQTRKMSLVK